MSALQPGPVLCFQAQAQNSIFPPVLSPAGDTQQVLLHLAPRQSGSSTAISATRLDLELWSPGSAVVRMGQRVPEQEFCFGLHWFVLPQGSESAAGSSFIDALF